MADKHRPEVNLEISSGFFRIATQEVIFNLSIIPDKAGLPVVEKIVEVEKRVDVSGLRGGSDSYFRQISQEVLSSLADLGRDLVPLEEAMGSRKEKGIDPQKIGEARTILAELREAAGKSGPSPQLVGDDIAELVGKLQQLIALADSAGSSPSAAAPAEKAPPEPPASPAARRYLFDLDVVFQTLYELCTNETVKTHITSAREKSDTFFDNALFLDRMNEKVVHLEPDSDNFLNVPISDVLASLQEGCKEKPIQNLLKKMDSNQGTIFLDAVLPLEVPAVAEAEVEAGAEVDSPESEPVEEVVAKDGSEDAGRLAEIGVLLDEVLQLVDDMAGKVAGEQSAESFSAEPGAGSEELAGRIDQLDEVLASTLPEAPEAEEETADDQGLVAFRQRLLEAVLTLEGEIRLKKEDETLSADEARQQAAAEAAGKAAAVRSQEELEQLLTGLGL